MAFLTDEQRRNYGTFTQVPDDGQLAGYFLLDRDARRRAMACRGARSQLGYGVQLGTVRFLGTFLDNPEDTPAEVVAYVADQLGYSPSVLAGYGAERTRWDYQGAIKDAYGYRDLKGEAWWKLARWLWDRCWSGNERPIALFDLATLHLVEDKVLLPGATVLERMVTSVREHTNRKTWRTLAARPDATQRAALTGLLPVEDSRRTSKLDRLRRSPRDITGPGAGKAIDRFAPPKSKSTSVECGPPVTLQEATAEQEQEQELKLKLETELVLETELEPDDRYAGWNLNLHQVDRKTDTREAATHGGLHRRGGPGDHQQPLHDLRPRRE